LLEEVATTRFDLGRLVDLLHPFGGLGRSGRTHAQTLVLEEGERRQLAIDLAAPAATPAPAAPLHGQVAIDGAPAPDCDVLLGPDGSYDTAKQLRARTGSDGSFTFAQLPEGTHTLRVQRAGMTLEARLARLAPASTRSR
jgi:hypothetical protein